MPWQVNIMETEHGHVLYQPCTMTSICCMMCGNVINNYYMVQRKKIMKFAHRSEPKWWLWERVTWHTKWQPPYEWKHFIPEYCPQQEATIMSKSFFFQHRLAIHQQSTAFSCWVVWCLTIRSPVRNPSKVLNLHNLWDIITKCYSYIQWTISVYMNSFMINSN